MLVDSTVVGSAMGCRVVKLAPRNAQQVSFNCYTYVGSAHGCLMA